MSSQRRDLLKLIRNVNNRLCADCSAPLLEGQSISASLRYSVFLCSKCAEVHALILGSLSELKQVGGGNQKSDDWSAGEIAQMQEGVSNARVNETLERFVPEEWAPLTPDSTLEDRKLWVKAKYGALYFTIPADNYTFKNYTSGHSSGSSKSKESQDSIVLPTRLIDYLITIGPGKCKLLPAELQHLSSPRSALLHPEILGCTPPVNTYGDMVIPELLPPCAFPLGLYLSDIEKSPAYFTFVLTNADGVKLYGATLHIYELVDPEELAKILGCTPGSAELPNWPIVYVPKGITVISHYSFYNLFTTLLRDLYHISLSSAPLPLERYVINMLQEAPLPPKGKVEVQLALPNVRRLQISRPAPNKLPMVDFSYRPLFACLSVENILKVFSCLCAELTVCICSDNLALLTPVQESLLSLLFPFVWQGCYIPVMPMDMTEILDAPVPFLVGLHGSYLRTTPKTARPQSVVFVDLDKDIVDLGRVSEDVFSAESQERTLPPLPKHAAQKLITKLNEFGGCIHRSQSIMWKVRSAATPFMAQEHLVPLTFSDDHSMSTKLSIDSSRSSGYAGSGSSSLSTPLPSSSGGGGGGIASNIAKAAAGLASPSKKLFAHHMTSALAHPQTTPLHGGSSGGISRGNSTMPPTSEAGGVVCGHVASTLVSPATGSILDPVNNTALGGDGDKFDANMIRKAFLRFFIVIMWDYHDFFRGASSPTNKLRQHYQEGASHTTTAAPSASGGGTGAGGGEKELRLTRSTSGSSLEDSDLSGSSGNGASGKDYTGKGSITNTGRTGARGLVSRVGHAVAHRMSLTSSRSKHRLLADTEREDVSANANARLSGKSNPSSINSARPSSSSSNNQAAVRRMRSLEGQYPEEMTFDQDAFIGHRNEPFLQALVETQMFSNFIEESIRNQTISAGHQHHQSSPRASAMASASASGRNSHLSNTNQKSPELLFFDESMIEKKNRSSLTLSREGTPFLNDTSDDITEKITVPDPSAWGIDVGSAGYNYPQFPILNPQLFGPIRPARVLIRSTERARQQSSVRTTRELRDALKRMESKLKDPLFSNTLPHSSSPSQHGAQHTDYGAPPKFALQKRLSELFRHLASIMERNQKILKSFIRVQSLWRRRRLQLLFRKIRSAIISIQCAHRSYISRKILALEIRLRKMAKYVALVIKAQAFIRQSLYRRKYRRFLVAIITLQSYRRMKLQRRDFSQRKQAAIIIETRVRGWQERKRQHAIRVGTMAKRRKALLTLWAAEHTPLVYRSKFWMVICEPTYLHLAICEDELRRLELSLGRLSGVLRPQYLAEVPTTSRAGQHQRAAVLPPPRGGLSSMSGGYLGGEQMKERFSETKEREERENLYKMLKKSTPEGQRQSLFKLFGIEGNKRRKHTLASIVWSQTLPEHADLSAQIICVVAVTSAESASWLERKMRERITAACVLSVRACMLSLQSQQANRKHNNKDKGSSNNGSKEGSGSRTGHYNRTSSSTKSIVADKRRR